MDKMNKIVDFKTILKQRVDEWNNGIMQRDNDGAESIKRKSRIASKTNLTLIFFFFYV